MDIKPVISFKRLILNHMVARSFKCFSQDRQIIDQKGRMGFPRRPEILLNAEMQLYRAAGKPASATRGQISGFDLLRKAKQAAIKARASSSRPAGIAS